MSNNIIDVEDEVVREIPVILSQDLNGRLYLIQHPLRPPWRTLDTDQLQEVYFIKYYSYYLDHLYSRSCYSDPFQTPAPIARDGFRNA